MKNNPNIITGDVKLDTEHIQIFDTIEMLQVTDLPQYKRIAICENLLHYISKHCKEEELFMEFNEYPAASVHKESHTILQNEFLKHLSFFIRHGGEHGEAIKDLFYGHVINVDLPMISYIRSKNKLLD